MKPQMFFPHHMGEASIAVDVVRTAARLCRAVQHGVARQALTKRDASPVTVADFASQALVSHLLGQAFPGDALVAEEDAALLASPEGMTVRDAAIAALAEFDRDIGEIDLDGWIERGGSAPSGRFWILDPVDGTKGFVRGDQYVVALALIEAGQVQVAALGCPNMTARFETYVAGPGCVALAVRGEGAWIAPLDRGEMAGMRVSDRGDARLARVLRSFEDAHTDPEQLERIFRFLGVQEEPRRMDSQAKALVLAGGEAELVFRLVPSGNPGYHEKIWDAAAGSLLVEEAGGRVTDLRGNRLDFTAGRELVNNLGVISSNGRLHAAALAAIRAAMPEAAR